MKKQHFRQEQAEKENFSVGSNPSRHQFNELSSQQQFNQQTSALIPQMKLKQHQLPLLPVKVENQLTTSFTEQSSFLRYPEINKDSRINQRGIANSIKVTDLKMLKDFLLAGNEVLEKETVTEPNKSASPLASVRPYEYIIESDNAIRSKSRRVISAQVNTNNNHNICQSEKPPVSSQTVKTEPNQRCEVKNESKENTFEIDFYGLSRKIHTQTPREKQTPNASIDRTQQQRTRSRSLLRQVKTLLFPQDFFSVKATLNNDLEEKPKYSEQLNPSLEVIQQKLNEKLALAAENPPFVRDSSENLRTTSIRKSKEEKGFRNGFHKKSILLNGLSTDIINFGMLKSRNTAGDNDSFGDSHLALNTSKNHKIIPSFQQRNNFSIPQSCKASFSNNEMNAFPGNVVEINNKANESISLVNKEKEEELFSFRAPCEKNIQDNSLRSVEKLERQLFNAVYQSATVQGIQSNSVSFKKRFFHKQARQNQYASEIQFQEHDYPLSWQKKENSFSFLQGQQNQRQEGTIMLDHSQFQNINKFPNTQMQQEYPQKQQQQQQQQQSTVRSRSFYLARTPLK